MNLLNLLFKCPIKFSHRHTQWVDGRQPLVSNRFQLDLCTKTVVPTTISGTNYDVDWTNEEEGISTSVSTYSAVTSCSYHTGGVNALLMDGSIQFYANEINHPQHSQWRRTGPINATIIKPHAASRAAAPGETSWDGPPRADRRRC